MTLRNTHTSHLRHRRRNFGIIAHVDAGKTTLTERMLHHCGRIHAMGEVHDGNTVTDFDPREQAHGITISAAAVSCEHDGHRLQLIDTPGHIDFSLEVERSLAVLDGAVVVLDGVAGVEPQTESVWRQADRYRVPRCVFINKLDRAGADFEGVRLDVEKRFGVLAPVVVLPQRDLSGELVGVVDLVDPIAGDLPAVEARAWRERLLELCADLDDTCAELYLDSGDIPRAELVRTLREATRRGRIVPVLGGSAYRHVGVQPVLDAVVRYLPAPHEAPDVVDVTTGAERERSAEAPLCAFTFNLSRGSHGFATFVRIFSGTLRRGQKVHSAHGDTLLRVGRLATVFADRLEPVDSLNAGDIGVVLGMRQRMGDTLSDPAHPICLASLEVPPPVVRVALEAKSRAEAGHLSTALHTLCLRDPSLHVEVNPESGRLVLAGLGELHIEIALERLTAEHGLSVHAFAPRVAYREGLTRSTTIEHTLSKQSGGPGMYAKINLTFEPADKGDGLVFTDARRGDDLPSRYVEAVRRGIIAGMATGPVGGYPILDMRATLHGGAAHSHDSSDLAFETAATQALRRAAAKMAPVLLEPVMCVEVRTSAEHVGAIVSDLASRRGHVLGIDHDGDRRVVHARAPLAEMFGYARRMLSLTHGRGSFTMSFDGHEHVPQKLWSQVLDKIA